MADDLAPAAVERAARALDECAGFLTTEDGAECACGARITDRVEGYAVGAWRLHVARAALTAARAGEPVSREKIERAEAAVIDVLEDDENDGVPVFDLGVKATAAALEALGLTGTTGSPATQARSAEDRRDPRDFEHPGDRGDPMTEKITTTEELDALPVGSVVVNPFDNGEFHKMRTGRWIDAGGSWWLASEMVQDDQEYVLYRPDAPTPSAEDREALDNAARAARHARYADDGFVGWSDQSDAHDAGFRAGVAWFAARQPAPTVSAEQVTSFAEALRAEVHEHGSDGHTFEAVICAWLTGDYDGPALGIEVRDV